MALRTDYDWTKASDETREAMRDRCYEQGHDWQNVMDIWMHAFQECKWCGETR